MGLQLVPGLEGVLLREGLEDVLEGVRLVRVVPLAVHVRHPLRPALLEEPDLLLELDVLEEDGLELLLEVAEDVVEPLLRGRGQDGGLLAVAGPASVAQARLAEVACK